MTDKQIIDGVDVSKCKYIDIENFEKPICHCISQRNECEMPCEYNKDCHYKQLKRKEQECEELKKELHQIFKEKDGLHLIIDRLLEASGYDTNTASAEDFEDVYENMRYEKQQLDQLKIDKDELEKELRQKKMTILMNNDHYFEVGQTNKKLKQTLQEIKDIAEENIRIADLEGLNGVYRRGLAEQILQKISECEVE